MALITDIPNDGYSIPDTEGPEPMGQETHGEWTLRWSGWHQGFNSSGYVLKKTAWWAAFRKEDPNIHVVMCNGPVVLLKDGDNLPESEGLYTIGSNHHFTERARLLKLEGRARLLDLIGKV